MTRPAFTACIKAIRKAAGDKRQYTETQQAGYEGYGIRFEFSDDRAAQRALGAMTLLAGQGLRHSKLRYSAFVIFRNPCMHCATTYDEHVPAGGQCLFASTNYTEKLDD